MINQYLVIMIVTKVTSDKILKDKARIKILT